mgnify:CR=1 FL=1
MRYYYKANNGKGFLNLKTPLENKDGYTQITEDEFDKLTRPPELTEEQKATIAKAKQILALKKKLSDTDYIVLKIAEAIAENDTESVAILKQTYVTELENRKIWRAEVNALEKE